MLRLNNPLKIFVALFLLVLGFLIVFSENSKDERSSYPKEPIRILEFNLENVPDEDKPKRITIPKLSIDLEVNEANIIDGFWEVFDTKAGWGKGSSPPGFVGNQVIFAHARKGLFGNLDKIEINDNIYVFNEGERYLYNVTEIMEVYPGETEVISMTDDERLTLYTCSGFRDQKRLVVIAKRSV